MMVLDEEHEEKVKEFITKWENHDALKQAGVSIKRERFDYISGGNTLASFIYIHFKVAPNGAAPKTDAPAAQNIA